MNKINSRLSYLLTVSLGLGLVLIFSSCSKESTDEIMQNSQIVEMDEEITMEDLMEYKDLKEFPDELTIDNWRMFIHAPKQVREKVMQSREMQGKYSLNEEPSEQIAEHTLSKLPPQFTAQVRRPTSSSFFPYSFPYIDGITISSGSCSDVSDYTYPWASYNASYPLFAWCNGSVCMTNPSQENNYLNGVDMTDLLLIADHIISLANTGVGTFTVASQWIAADANCSHNITTLDLVEIQKWINQGQEPVCRNFVFIPQYLINNGQEQLENTNVVDLSAISSGSNNYSECLPMNTNNNKRLYIKIGDVDFSGY